MRNRVHQVRLAEADAAIQEQWVEADRSTLGHAFGGGMGQFVRLADNKGVKGKARIQRCTGQMATGGRLGRGGRLCAGRRFLDGARFGLGHRRGHLDIQATHPGRHRHDVLQQLVAVVLRDIGAEEIGWRLQRYRSFRGRSRETQRYDPCLMVILPDSLADLVLQDPPLLFGHLPFCPRSSIPTPNTCRRRARLQEKQRNRPLRRRKGEGVTPGFGRKTPGNPVRRVTMRPAFSIPWTRPGFFPDRLTGATQRPDKQVCTHPIRRSATGSLVPPASRARLLKLAIFEKNRQPKLELDSVFRRKESRVCSIGYRRKKDATYSGVLSKTY